MTGPSERPLGLAGRGALVLFAVVSTILASADPFTLVFFLSYAAVGVVLAIRRPRNRVSWLVLAVGFGFIPTTAQPWIDGEALAAGTASWPDFVNAWTGSWGGTAGFVAMLALTLVFPSGRLPAGRWRGPAITVLAVSVATVVLTAIAPTFSFNLDGGPTSITIPNRFTVLPGLPLWALVPADGSLSLIVIALLAIGVFSMLVRYRRARGILRLQLRWLVASLSFVILALMGAFAALSVAGEELGAFVWIPAIVAYPTVPIAIGVSITRYRLYEIDRIVSRTISWGLVTAALVAAFAGGVLVLQAALSGLTQGQTFAVAASTLLSFALFQPLRRRVQAAVDRRFFRARYDAGRAAEDLAQRLRAEVDLDTIRRDVAGTVGETMQPRAAGLWIRRADG